MIALAAAIAEIRGTPIVPQVRRQLPEHWRRLMPMPLAAGLYGILLGLGFTTFVLTFGVFALAAISFALGEPAIGIAVGLAFGTGRALPIAIVAPVADRDLGVRVTTLMAERPAIYRGFRFGDAIALAACAAALVVAVPAARRRPRCDLAPILAPPGTVSCFSAPTVRECSSAAARRLSFPAKIPRSATDVSRLFAATRSSS